MNIAHRIASNNKLNFLIAMIIIESLFFFYYGISRHYNYMTSLNDLGHMDQAVWGTLNGELLLNSDTFNKPISRFGIHFDPILALFLPFYTFFPSVVWLILAQAIAIPMTSLPIYFFAKRICQSEKVAFLWAATCLFSPFMLSAASWDLHPVTLAAPFIALGFLAVEKRQHAMLFFSCSIILLCKEHFGLLVMGFGMLWYVRQRSWKTSLLLIVFGVGFFFLILKLLMPSFSPSGQHIMFSKDLGQLSRYVWLGHSLGEIAINIVTNPLDIAQRVLIDMRGFVYLILLFLPLLCLPLIGVEFLLPGIADLLVNLLSANPMPRSLYAYHSATLVPVFIAAAIYGSVRAGSFLKNVRPELLASAILIITLGIGWVTFPFFSLSGRSSSWEPKRVLAFHDPHYSLARDVITQNMSISVQANIGAHFTQRHEVYIYPNKIDEVDAVVLRLESPVKSSGISSLAHHLQMDPFKYLDSVRELLALGEYSNVFWLDPWLIIVRGKGTAVDLSPIFEKLDKLKLEWESSFSAINR